MTRPVAGTVLLAFLIATPIGAQSGFVAFTGRVAADDNGSPLPHARVAVYNDATPISTIFTNTDGRFSTPPLGAGRYRLTVTKPGYATKRVERLDPRNPADIRMQRSAAISGRVYDTFGDPVMGIPVTVFPASGDTNTAPIKVVSTDDLGEYRVGGLPQGAYLVSVNQVSLDESSGLVNRQMAFFPSLSARNLAQPLVLSAGDQRTGVDFAGITTQASLAALASTLAVQPNLRISVGLQNNAPKPAAGTASIRGRITRADGLGVPRVVVTAMFQRRPDSPPIATPPTSVTTDDDGSYEFEELLHGDYRIRAAKPGFLQTLYGQRSPGDPAAVISVGERETRTHVDLVLPRQAAIVGELIDDFGDPVEGATVDVWQIRFQSGRRRLVSVTGGSTAVTDDLGHYRLFGVPPGQYVVSAAVGQVSTQPGGSDISGFAPTYFPGTTNPGEARLVAVSGSQDVVGVDFALVPLPTARIVGRRIGSDGQPMGGSIVLMRSQRSGAIVTPSTGARIYADGQFEFPNVAPGEYVIQADTGKSNAEREGDFVSQFVTVNGADITGLLLQSTPGSTISGRVLFDGDPPTSVRGMSIEPARADLDRTPHSNGSIARASLQPDFTFVMEGIHGPRRLVVNRPPSGWMMKSVTAGGVDVTDAVLPLGTRDQSLSDVEIVLTNRITELTGTVTDSRGQPAAGYTLLVFPTDRDRWYSGSRFFRRAAAEAAGNFSVRGLPPGDYFLAPVSGMSVLREGNDAWQDLEVLDLLSLRATHVTLSEGQKLSINAQLIVA